MHAPDTSTARLVLIIIALMAFMATASAIIDMGLLSCTIAVGLWVCTGLMAFAGAAKKPSPPSPS